jgi:hypothetical protein
MTTATFDTGPGVERTTPPGTSRTSAPWTSHSPASESSTSVCEVSQSPTMTVQRPVVSARSKGLDLDGLEPRLVLSGQDTWLTDVLQARGLLLATRPSALSREARRQPVPGALARWPVCEAQAGSQLLPLNRRRVAPRVLPWLTHSRGIEREPLDVVERDPIDRLGAERRPDPYWRLIRPVGASHTEFDPLAHNVDPNWTPEARARRRVNYQKGCVCRPFVSIGETGFEPATARPPAGRFRCI